MMPLSMAKVGENCDNPKKLLAKTKIRQHLAELGFVDGKRCHCRFRTWRQI